MRAWQRKSSLGGVKLRSEVDAREAAVLRSLVESVAGLLAQRAADAPVDDLAELTGIRSGHTSAPDDSTLARLLPDFQAPDAPVFGNEKPADLNGALRSLHEPAIIDAKRTAATILLETLPEAGGRIVLTREQADSWLTALNDVRLALGATLEVDAETPDSYPPDDPRAPHLDVYHWLTWMQDSLVQALMP